MIRILLFIGAFYTSLVFADCSGPPNSPIIKIDIKSCKLSEDYENTLKITGKARQVLSIYWRGVKATGDMEVIRESKDISESTFWMSANYQCEFVINSQEKLWLYDDICNDTGQNIPSIQLQELWSEINLKAVKVYEMPNKKAPNKVN